MKKDDLVEFLKGVRADAEIVVENQNRIKEIVDVIYSMYDNEVRIVSDD